MSEKCGTYLICICHPIITRLIILVTDNRHTDITHRHKMEQVIQESLFTDHLVLGLTQLDTNAYNISQ